MKIKIVSLLFIVWLLSLTLSHAAVTGLEFLKIIPGARPAALGESFVALSDDINAVYYNPAGLGFIIRPELQATHMIGLADIYTSFVGYLQPLKTGSFAVAGQYMGMPSIRRIENGVLKDRFSPCGINFGLTYGHKFSRVFTTGLTLRYLYEHLDTDYYTQILCSDFGILYRTFNELFSAGLSVQNLGSNFMFSGSDIEEKIPTLFHGGIGFKFNLPEHDSDINVSIEGGQYQNGYQYASFGIEHIGAKTLALRLGYRYVMDEEYRRQLDSLSQWRAGLGLKIKTVVIDYAYQPYAKLGDAHRISFTKKFIGWKMTARQLPAALKVDPAIFSPNSDGIKDIVFFFPKHKTIKKIKSCQLTICDSMGVAVQKLTEKELPNILSWDGRDISGRTVLEGEYFAEFVLQGEGKVARSREKSLRVDLTPPAVNLEASAETISPDGDRVDDTLTFNLTASDTNLIDRWKLDILNQKNNIIKSYKSASAVNRNSVIKTILWDGKDELYGKVVPNDMYNVKLSVWDIAGNKKLTESFVNVYVPPKVIEKIIEKVKVVRIKEEARGLVVSLSSEVLFGVGKFTLKRASAKALNEVVEILRAYPENKVKIEGHTDSTGPYEKNVALSSKRAWNVYSYLIKKGGIDPKRLSAKGYGPDKPIVSNSTAVGRAKNRRVEIIILKK